MIYNRSSEVPPSRRAESYFGTVAGARMRGFGVRVERPGRDRGGNHGRTRRSEHSPSRFVGRWVGTAVNVRSILRGRSLLLLRKALPVVRGVRSGLFLLLFLLLLLRGGIGRGGGVTYLLGWGDPCGLAGRDRG